MNKQYKNIKSKKPLSKQAVRIMAKIEQLADNARHEDTRARWAQLDEGIGAPSETTANWMADLGMDALIEWFEQNNAPDEVFHLLEKTRDILRVQYEAKAGIHNGKFIDYVMQGMPQYFDLVIEVSGQLPLMHGDYFILDKNK